ncbi:MAG: hypothetical protein ACRECY_16255 [Phyllobacterium sp.]
MNLYFRLEPAEDFTQHVHWNASKICEACWVRAASEREARLIASTRLTGRMAREDSPGADPWLNGLLVRCCRDVPPLSFDNRSLITQSGVTFL